MPSKGFLKRISNPDLTHKSASTVAQLMILHIPLNAYLQRFKKVDSAHCPTCGAKREDLEHFLLFCPSYAHKRWLLKQQAKKKRKCLTMEMLLGDLDLTVHLANYIDAMHRFK